MNGIPLILSNNIKKFNGTSCTRSNAYGTNGKKSTKALVRPVHILPVDLCGEKLWNLKLKLKTQNWIKNLKLKIKNKNLNWKLKIYYLKLKIKN